MTGALTFLPVTVFLCMIKGMKYSIILPAYNVENDIENSLNDLLAQTCRDFEVIVVDDCATDKTGQIADKYKERFSERQIACSVIHKKENEGLSMARNTGMENAAGEYILFLDADDRYEPRLLEALSHVTEQEKADVIVYGFTEDYYEKNTVDYRIEKLPRDVGFAFGPCGEPLWRAFPYIAELERDTLFGYAWNKAYRLDFIRKYGMRFEKVTHIEDVLFNLQAASHMESMACVSAPLYHYCNRGQARLTAKYLPDYFELQKRRYAAFLNMQGEKQKKYKNEITEQEVKGWEEQVNTTVANAYFRSFQSFFVREISHKTPKHTILTKAREELTTDLFKLLKNALHPQGKTAKLLYRPLAQGKIKTAYRRSFFIAFIQGRMPRLYAKLKQNR